ncbi:Sodium-coupled monocarboxylate transporter 2 [Blattella germanica]|nr:Sodium-coupled monocarboxylate transporter 2 [Blattella germanica]
MLGLFTFGMVYPRGNSKGALAGSLCCLLIMGWIVFGNQLAIADGSFKFKTLATTTHGCLNVTVTETTSEPIAESEVFFLFRITFMYYTLMGVAIVLVVGTLVSLVTEEPNQEQLDPVLFTPLVRKYIRRNRTDQGLQLQ